MQKYDSVQYERLISLFRTLNMKIDFDYLYELHRWCNDMISRTYINYSFSIELLMVDRSDEELLEMLARLTSSCPPTKNYAGNTEFKKSLMFVDVRLVSRTDVLRLSKNGFNELCRLHGYGSRFQEFDDLYSDAEIDQVMTQTRITRFLCLLGSLIKDKCVIVVIEWLIYEHKAHIRQPEDIITAFLALHDHPIFPIIVQVIDTIKLGVKGICPLGKVMSMTEVSNLCLNNEKVMSMLCEWLCKIVNMEPKPVSNQRLLGKKMCDFLKGIGPEIIIGAFLKRFEKRERYIHQIIHLLSEGLKSANGYFFETCIQWTIILSKEMKFDESLIRSLIDPILDTSVIEWVTPANRCQAIIEILTHQKYCVQPKKFIELFKKITNNRHRQLILFDIKKAKVQVDLSMITEAMKTILSSDEYMETTNVNTTKNENEDEAILKEKLSRINHLLETNKGIVSKIREIEILTMINERNIIELPEQYRYVWEFFIGKLRQVCSDGSIEEDIKTSMAGTIKSIGLKFSELSIDNQELILASITEHHMVPSTISVAIELLSSLKLSPTNYNFLLRDEDQSMDDNESTDGESDSESDQMTDGLFKSESNKSIGTDPDNLSPISQLFSQPIQHKIEIVLSAFSVKNHCDISQKDQIEICQSCFSIIKRTASHLSMKGIINKRQAFEDGEFIGFFTSVMTAIITVLSTAKQPSDIGSLSNKINLEEFSQCLFLFTNRKLIERTISVIQIIVKLGLDFDHTNILELISWIANNLIPSDEESSVQMLESIITETIPIWINLNKENQFHYKLKIMRIFIEEALVLEKDPRLSLFQSIVISFSDSDGNERPLKDNILWIQLIFMLAMKSIKFSKGIKNQSCIIPLLRKFSLKEQIYSLNKILSFLCFLLHDQCRKRKLNGNDTNSPMSKKRKTNTSSVEKGNNVDNVAENSKNRESLNDNEEFSLVKDHLTNVISNPQRLFEATIRYCELCLTGSSSQLRDANSSVVKDFISGLSVLMRSISSTGIPNKQKNELCHSLMELIEYLSSLMDLNDYLSMIIDLVIKNTDETHRSQCLALLSNKLSRIPDSVTVKEDQKMINVVLSILPSFSYIITYKMDSPDWECYLICVSSIISLGFSYLKKSIKVFCLDLFCSRLKRDLCKLSSEKLVLANLYLKHFITADLCKDLPSVLKYCLIVFDKFINNESSITNRVLKSNLQLVYSIVCRPELESIGWDLLTQLYGKLFELVSVETKLSKNSKESVECEKRIRRKFCQMNNTKALIDCCTHLSNTGIHKKNLMFVSGSIKLFECHLKHLNQSKIKYVPDENESHSLWKLICDSLSIKEKLEGILDDDVKDIEKKSAKAVTQLCHLMEFDEEVLKKLFNWCQQSDNSAQFYIERVSSVYRLVSSLISSSAKEEENGIKVINSWDVIPVGNDLLKYLIIESTSKRKKHITQFNSSFIVPFLRSVLVKDYSKECGEMIRSISSTILCYLRLKDECGMNLYVSDETIDLISTVCRCIVSIDLFLDKEDYENTCNKHLSPLIIQIAAIYSNNKSLLRHLATGLCKRFSNLGVSVRLVVLKTLSDLKLCLGDLFESSIRETVSCFIENCRSHNDNDVRRLTADV